MKLSFSVATNNNIYLARDVCFCNSREAFFPPDSVAPLIGLREIGPFELAAYSADYIFECNSDRLIEIQCDSF